MRFSWPTCALVLGTLCAGEQAEVLRDVRERLHLTSFIVAARDASCAGLACFCGSVCTRSVSSALLQLTGAFVWICACVLGVGGSATACACLQADAPLSARARGGSITDQLQSAGQQTRFFFFVVFCCKMTALPRSEHARFTTPRPVMNEAPCALMFPRSSGEEACARARWKNITHVT